MTLNNTKSNNRGFTLVELLIVIVVIAILAAISLVAFNGIQDRSKTTANQAFASTIAKKAEAFNTVNSVYPADVAAFGTLNDSILGSDASKVKGTAPTANTSSEVGYKRCAAGGAQVSYWSFTSNPKGVVYVGLGGAPSGTAACP